MNHDIISRMIAGTNIRENVLGSVLEIAGEISNEGREGKPIGTAFLVACSESF